MSAPSPCARPGSHPGRALAQAGAIAVEYALVMCLAAAILVGVETSIFRPMAKEILQNFMEFIVSPDP